jgi:hypothetical protein
MTPEEYPECPNCARYKEAAFRDAIEFSKFRTMLQVADDRIAQARAAGFRECREKAAKVVTDWADTSWPTTERDDAHREATDIAAAIRTLEPGE